MPEEKPSHKDAIKSWTRMDPVKLISMISDRCTMLDLTQM